MGTSESTLRQLNSERLPRIATSRRTMLIGILGAMVGGGATYAAPKVYDWVMDADGTGHNRLLHWAEPKHVRDGVQWQTFAANKDANVLPRSWRKLGILEVESGAYDASRLSLREEFGEELSQAIAYKDTEGTVQMGFAMVDGEVQDFLGVSSDGYGQQRSVGMRIGPGALHATMGYFSKGTNTFIGAPEVQNKGIVAIDKLAQSFPGAVWV